MTSITDDDGDEVAIYEYDAFGNVLTEAGSLSNQFKFSTKQADSRGQLIDFGFRWYDPEVGRWTQRDPIGVAGGLNLYTYCNSEPVNLIDPWGLRVAGGTGPNWSPPGAKGPPKRGQQKDFARAWAGDDVIVLVITDDTGSWDKFYWNVLGNSMGVDFIDAGVGDVPGVTAAAANAYEVYGPIDKLYVSSHGMGQFGKDKSGVSFAEDITRAQGEELSQYFDKGGEIKFYGCGGDEDNRTWRTERAWHIHDATGLGVTYYEGGDVGPGPIEDGAGEWITIPWYAP